MNYLTPNWPAPAQVRAYTTLRTSFSDRHDPTARHQLNTALQLPSEPIWLKQTHSTLVVKATPDHQEQVADASFTDQKNHICAILTADCLPILICHKQGTHIAAIHAGWRGLANGIIKNTLTALALPAHDLLVWLGPAIGPQKFVVGRDVYDAFVNTNPNAATAFTAFTDDKWLANLYALATLQLREQGILSIYGGQFCTYTQEDLFFSYRRDHGQTGRMASLIWLA